MTKCEVGCHKRCLRSCGRLTPPPPQNLSVCVDKSQGLLPSSDHGSSGTRNHQTNQPLLGLGAVWRYQQQHLFLCTRWQYIAISLGYVHFQQILRDTKSKSAKFSSRWSKVLPVLGPLEQVIAILVARRIGGNYFFPNARAKIFHFSPQGNVGRFSLLRNVGKSTVEILSQAGVFPELWPF